ncbi:MAG: LamG-like jellyroll fold domain-containing protein, partial [Gemmataceae bacterium]
VNDAPSATVPSTLTVTEDVTGNLLFTGTPFADVDAASGSMTVTLTVADGTITAAAGTGITVGGTATARTITGTLAVLNSYITTAGNITYLSAANNDSSRTLTVTISDLGNTGSGGTLTGTATSTILISSVNDRPVATAGATLNYTENGAAAVIDATITLTDVDDANLTGATVTISTGFVSGDTLGFTDQSGITGSYNATTGVLTLSGTATKAQYQTALRSVTFYSTSEDPTNNYTLANRTRTISWQVTDGNSAGAGAGALASTAVTSTINVTGVNDPPVATAGATLSYTENGAASVVDATITLTDADDTALASATVTLTSVVSGDLLAFSNSDASLYGNISGSYNSGTGVLTLTSSGSTATVAQWQSALRSVTYSSTSEDPTVANTRNSRTVTWAVTDANSDSVGAQTSAGVTSTINIAAVNDAAVMGAGASAAYTENAPATGSNTYSLSFDGSNDVVVVPDDNQLDLSANLTLEAWIYPTSSSDGIIFNKENSYEIARFGDGRIQYALCLGGDGNWAWVNSGLTAPLNTWTHVAMVKTGGSVTVYLNGGTSAGGSQATITGNPATLAPNTRDFRIGGRGNGGQPFAGRIDEARVWNRALSQSEVDTQRSQQIDGASNGLVAYYRFNEGAGTLAANNATTGSSLNGTLT